MYGYVYITTNLINGKIYIGQHKSEIFDKNYYGSGTIIQRSLSEYSKSNHNIEIIAKANSKQELDDLEKKFIKKYKEEYKEKCLNIASGGYGGNVWEHANKSDYDKFCLKTKGINNQRCSTEEFKLNCSINMKKRYEDPKEQLKQSEIVKNAWNDKVLKEQQSKRIKDFYKDKKRDCSFNNISYMIDLNGEKLHFESRKELDNYLSINYNGFNLPKGKDSKLNLDGSNKFYTKNKKYQQLNGMKVYKNYRRCRD